LHGVKISLLSVSASARFRAAVIEYESSLEFFMPFGSGQHENFEFSEKRIPKVFNAFLIETSMKGSL